jgi:hypothetical protein
LRIALVAARKRNPLGHAFVQLCETLRIELGLAQVGAQAMRRVLDFGQTRCQHFGQCLECGLQVLLLTKQVQGLVQ